MNAPVTITASHRESADNYRGEIFRVATWRVVTCRDHIQWILQRHTRAGRPDGGRWESKYYLTTRESVLRFWRTSTGRNGAELKVLLPERFKRGEG